MRVSPRTILKLISWWPPFMVAGIRVVDFDLERGYVVTRLRVRPWNRNYFGTHFGGSLYAMADPFYVFLLIQRLGRDYYVWDRASEIDFVKATSEDVFARFEVTAEHADEIRRQAASGEKVEPVWETRIETATGEVICHVKKRLYVRRKPGRRPPV